MTNYRRRFPFPLLILPLILLAGLIVMLLWNAIMPHAIHASSLNYLQSLGLLVLSRILFGGFRGGPGRRHRMWRGGDPSWREKWKYMSDEEKMKFREEWKNRCSRMNKNEETGKQ
ncbi:MAG: hypothetical protein JST21_15840 [Bacteroidetes bacterium]|nr:hypothetical protein [Bacteroidota bacterium]